MLLIHFRLEADPGPFAAESLERTAFIPVLSFRSNSD